MSTIRRALQVYGQKWGVLYFRSSCLRVIVTKIHESCLLDMGGIEAELISQLTPWHQQSEALLVSRE